MPSTSLQDKVKAERKWRVMLARQMSAVLRTLQLSRLPLSPPYDLTARRFRLWSQNEEDGIIVGLFEHAGVTDRRFVEIGSGRSGGNAALLAYECGWSGLMSISPRGGSESARALQPQPRRHRGRDRRVARRTSISCSATTGSTGEVDLLSIDIDSYDYWVLEALSILSPRVPVRRVQRRPRRRAGSDDSEARDAR